MIDEDKLKICMSELMTRSKLCLIKTERAIGMNKDFLKVLDEIKREQKDIDELVLKLMDVGDEE